MRSSILKLREAQKGAVLPQHTFSTRASAHLNEFWSRKLAAANCAGGENMVGCLFAGLGGDAETRQRLLAFWPVSLDPKIVRANGAAALGRALSPEDEEELGRIRAWRIATVQKVIDAAGYFESASEEKPWTSVDEAIATPWFTLVTVMPSGQELPSIEGAATFSLGDLGSRLITNS